MRPFQVAGYPRDLLREQNAVHAPRVPGKISPEWCNPLRKIAREIGVYGAFLPVLETFRLL
jgi:hypothetical protein